MKHEMTKKDVPYRPAQSGRNNPFKGGGSKPGFGHQHKVGFFIVDIDFYFEGLVYELCIFYLFLSFTIRLL